MRTAALSDFTLDSYEELLLDFRSSHEFITFCEYGTAPAQCKLILLRHDIDYSPADALRMARLEAGLGIRASYFFLLSSPLYNLLSERNCAVPRQVAELGHEVGLHYDSAALGGLAAPLDALEAQAALLAQLSGSPVTTVSQHNPSVAHGDINHGSLFTGAYDPRFTRQIAYFSDSCMAWRDEFAAAMQTGNLPDRFQLLIHPCLWTAAPLTREAKLERILAQCQAEPRDCARAVREIWRAHSGVREHECRRLVTQSCPAIDTAASAA